MKLQYGILETQFRRFFEEARRQPGVAGFNFLQLLERRLDNVVFRLRFARTRPMARQLVNHGHILVNGKCVDIPSYIVRVGETINLTEQAMQMPVVQEELQSPGAMIPMWLMHEDGAGRVVSLPRREDIDADIREDLIVEFYAR